MLNILVHFDFVLDLYKIDNRSLALMLVLLISLTLMVGFNFFIKWFGFNFYVNGFGLPFLKWFGLNGLRVHKRFGLVFVLYKWFDYVQTHCYLPLMQLQLQHIPIQLMIIQQFSASWITKQLIHLLVYKHPH